MTKMKIVEGPSPSQQIETILDKLRMEASETRKRTGRNILIVFALALIFYFVTYEYPQAFFLFVIDILLTGLGGIYIILFAIPTLVQPLTREEYAFKKIAEAAKILKTFGEKKEPLALKKAHRDVEKAYRTLKGTELRTTIPWYRATNETFNEFMKSLQQIVLPAIDASIIETEHLEEIALAIYSLDPTRINEVNITLGAEKSYIKNAIRTLGMSKGMSHRVSEFLRTEIRIPRDVAVILLLLVGCAVFYAIVDYLGYQKDTALGVAVAAFIGLLAIAKRGKKEFKSEWHVAGNSKR